MLAQKWFDHSSFTSACSSSVSTNGHLLVTRQYICCYCLVTLGGGITLTGQDLFILTEILRPAAPQWKTVGLALGFPDYELATIEQKPLLIPEGPPGYFREILSQWLKWAPPNHSLPTLESLAPALRSSGHEDLAVKLRTAFLQKKGRKTLNFNVSGWRNLIVHGAQIHVKHITCIEVHYTDIATSLTQDT